MLRVASTSDDQPSSIVDKIVLAEDKKIKNGLKEYYGLTVAHRFLNADQEGQFENSSEETFENVFRRFAQSYQQSGHNYYLASGNHKITNIVDTPLPQFKLWTQREEKQPILDIAFAKLDFRQLYRNRTSAQFASTVDVLQMNSEEDIIKEHGEKIVCAGKYGKLWEQPRITKRPCLVQGLNLVFDLDEGET